jgi:hypothetical protein
VNNGFHTRLLWFSRYARLNGGDKADGDNESQEGGKSEEGGKSQRGAKAAKARRKPYVLGL